MAHDPCRRRDKKSPAKEMDLVTALAQAFGRAVKNSFRSATKIELFMD
jgi:hypothetical protein